MKLRSYVRALLAWMTLAGLIGVWGMVILGWSDGCTASSASGALGPLAAMALTFYFKAEEEETRNGH